MKKIILSLSIAIIVSFVVFPVTVNAMIVNSKGNVTIAADETIDDDLFIAGETVTIRGVINGDVYAAGGTVDIDGVVNGDVLAAGGMVTISGQIKDDVRVAGGQVTISNAIIGDNVTVAGGNVSIDNQTTVGGSLSFGVGYFSVAAQVARGIVGGGGAVYMNGTVANDVSIGVGELRIGPDANIAGDISYTSDTKAIVDDSATVGGSITQDVPVSTKVDINEIDHFIRNILVVFAVGGFFSMLLVGAIMIFMARDALVGISKIISNNTLRVGGIGFIALIVFIPAVVLVSATIVGIPLAMIAGGMFTLFLYISPIIFSMSLGKWILKFVGNATKNQYAFLVVGLFTFTVVSIIPIIGGIVTLVALIIGLGAIITYSAQIISRNRLNG